MDKIQIIESELISLQYADEQMLEFLVTDLGSRAVLVAETFYLEFKYCTLINIDNDLLNNLFLPRFKTGKSSLFIQDISIETKDVRSRGVLNNRHVDKGYATAMGYEFIINFAFMDIVINCLDVNIVKKKDLERDIESLINYNEIE
ncbi:hypothetical protein [Veillonella sp.]|uniref:hypothetical protein n=1 Tax=Veillonella sp. TaxID=1926307 RepID=UPI00290A0DC9|nr:hypothetical protein [Veillonella sp.]MDU6548739.1 hypothetical protein [Veillonella sp.]